MQCITTVTYSFLINDSIYGSVKPQRGIRQGDPISPYLFILCGEVLSGLCRRAELDGSLRGLRVARGSPRVNHLLFADDTMMFCNSSPECCLSLRNILQEYEKVSGQKVNIAKSSITFSVKTSPETKAAVKETLGIQKEGGVGKYLGLPEHFGRRKKDMFTSIVDRIRQRASSWSNRFLSRAGKLTMLKAVLTAIPTYSMSCFQLPVSLCKRIQSTLTQFWWNSTSGKKKMCWVAWQKLTKPKAAGGLGLRDIQMFNQALLAKVAWRILTSPGCLLVRVLRGKYCHKKSFLDVQVPSVCSYGWRSILHGRDLLKDNLGKAIENGQDTRVWKDPWISLEKQVKPFGPVREANMDLRVSDLLTDDLKWNTKRVESILPEFSKQIHCIKPSRKGAEDIHIWLPLNSGVYSTKSGYNSVAELPQTAQLVPTPASGPEIDFSWIKDVWSQKTSPKLRLFLWSVIQGALPIGSELQRRGMVSAALCPRCKEEETTLHIFLQCPFAKEVWSHIPLKHSVHPADISEFRSLLVNHRSSICLPPTGIRVPILPWVCWQLWNARNRLIFEDKACNPRDTATKILSSALEWDQAQVSMPSRHRSNAPPVLQPPNRDDTQTQSQIASCFVDAAWDAACSRTGLACVIVQNPTQDHISESQIVDSVSSPLMAEAIALRRGLERALEERIPSIRVLSDCQTLIRAIVNKNQIKEIYGVLQDIDALSSLFSSVSFQHISRSQNRDADFSAKQLLKAHYLLSSAIM
ncbi:uncharacterized protein LOC108858662 [Raphanus sativus]|uniref:Uncharacterized protein LOC108858662 n=1 Tax=Raphanus sativus TaxID=3726 RepID=A0A6J0NV94_RAPSA|nr:uncharacterized protein LOC108858662 [Raphanus sativus]